MADSYVCSKARIRCSCGDRIATLTVFPDRTVWLTGQPQGNISDHVPMRNIAPFGRCHTVAFPATGSATAANHGHLTPMPCVPNTPFPWMGGKNDVLIKGQPALLKSSTCRCVYGGVISFTSDGQSSGTYQDIEKQQPDTQQELESDAEVELSIEEVLDGIQMVLDVAGLAPGVGAIPDLLNACVSACRGNWADAAFSLVAAIPGIGDTAGAAKIARNGVKLAKQSKKSKIVKLNKGEAHKLDKQLIDKPKDELAAKRAEKARKDAIEKGKVVELNRERNKIILKNGTNDQVSVISKNQTTGITRTNNVASVEPVKPVGGSGGSTGGYAGGYGGGTGRGDGFNGSGSKGRPREPQTGQKPNTIFKKNDPNNRSSTKPDGVGEKIDYDA